MCVVRTRQKLEGQMLFYETLYTKSNVSARLIIATFTQQIGDKLNCGLCAIVWFCINIQFMGI